MTSKQTVQTKVSEANQVVKGDIPKADHPISTGYPFSVDLYQESVDDCHEDTMNEDSDGYDSYENQPEADKDNDLRVCSKLTVRFQDEYVEDKSFSETEADRYSKAICEDGNQYLSLSDPSSISGSSAHLHDSNEPKYDQSGYRKGRLKERTKERLRQHSACDRNSSSEKGKKLAARRPQSCSPYRHNLQLTFCDFRDRYESTESIKLSDTDKKIIEVWLWKYEQEKLNEENARQKTFSWMIEREQAREKRLQDEKQHWADIERKRKSENVVAKEHYSQLMKKLEDDQAALQDYLEKKESSVKRKLRSITRSRNKLLEEKRRLEEDRRHIALSRVKKEEEQDRKRKEEALNKKIEKLNVAEEHRQAVWDACRKRLSQLRIEEEASHAARIIKLKIEYNEMVESMRSDIAEKHAKAESNYNCLKQQRDETRKKQRQIQDEKSQRAQEIVAELDRGMKQWRQEVLRMQKMAIERAESRVSSLLMARRNEVSRYLRERDVHHHENMKRLEIQERERLEKTKERIKGKLSRHSKFQEQKLDLVNEHKRMAGLGADLRSCLLEKFRPEDMEKKLCQMGLELKIFGHDYHETCFRACQCAG